MAQGDETLLSKMIQAFATHVQGLEDATVDLQYKSMLPNATGALLERIGVIVNEPKNGKNDMDYRTAIYATIYRNASMGEPERIIAAIAQLTGAALIHYREYYPAEIWVDYSASVVEPKILEYIKQVVSGGVALNLNKISLNHAFQFDSDGTSTDGFNTGILSTLYS